MSKDRIGRNQFRIFDDSLSDQEPIERIFVDRRQLFDSQGVRQVHRENLQTVRLLPGDDVRQGKPQSQFTKLSLDDDLLDADDAEP
ncbi:MAG TPA: hypothetical protein VH643_03600 [Gemmataceae bacterium]